MHLLFLHLISLPGSDRLFSVGAARLSVDRYRVLGSLNGDKASMRIPDMIPMYTYILGNSKWRSCSEMFTMSRFPERLGPSKPDPSISNGENLPDKE